MPESGQRKADHAAGSAEKDLDIRQFLAGFHLHNHYYCGRNCSVASDGQNPAAAEPYAAAHEGKGRFLLGGSREAARFASFHLAIDSYRRPG